MNYLLDTCLLSELYKAKPNPGVVEWLAGIEEERLFISALSLGEIQKGITKLDDGKRRRDIQTWLDQDVRQRFDGRALAVDLEIALEWGRLCGDSERRGSPVPVIDGLLAATAICRNLVLVSRNETDFSRFPIRLLNPWSGVSASQPMVLRLSTVDDLRDRAGEAIRCLEELFIHTTHGTPVFFSRQLP